MSRICWSKTVRRPMPVKTSGYAKIRIGVLLVLAATLLLGAGACWHWSAVTASQSGVPQRATVWPQQSRLPRRADTANIVWFTSADQARFSQDLEALYHLVRNRLVLLTVVYAPQDAKKTSQPTRKLTVPPAPCNLNVQVFVDEQGLAKRAFGVRHQEEFLVYGADALLVDTALTIEGLARILNQSNVAPLLHRGANDDDTTRFISRNWAFQLSSP